MSIIPFVAGLGELGELGGELTTLENAGQQLGRAIVRKGKDYLYDQGTKRLKKALQDYLAEPRRGRNQDLQRNYRNESRSQEITNYRAQPSQSAPVDPVNVAPTNLYKGRTTKHLALLRLRRRTTYKWPRNVRTRPRRRHRLKRSKRSRKSK